MTSVQEDWKHKYRELASEHEREQQASGEQMQNLSQLVTNMAMALHGDDPQLDAELDQLKRLISGEQQNPALKKVTRQLDKRIRVRDAAREQNAKKILTVIHKWIAELKQVTRHEATTQMLEALHGRSQGVVDRMYELPQVLSDLVELQSGVIHATCDDANYDLQPPESDRTVADADTRMLLRYIAAELLELIGSLHIPQAEQPLARKLTQQVEQGFELPDLPQLMHELVSLVTRSSNNTSEDFERYLLALSEQLNDVQSFLADSRKEQVSVGQSHRQLDQQVRSDVRKLNEAVKTSHEITDLKKAVTQQLVGIMRAMDTFKRSEEEREIRLQERYETLIGKVERMEVETQQVKAHMEEERLRARTDPLTGMPNRAAYDDLIRAECERWSRYRTPLSVAVGDLDFFKRINDSYGHLAGDKVLRLVAKVLSRAIRSSDFIARYGGEEFVLVLPSTDLAEARQALEKLRAAVESSPFNFHGKPVSVTMSFGVTEARENDTVDDLFSRADTMLYQAKENGRNRICSD